MWLVVLATVGLLGQCHGIRVIGSSPRNNTVIPARWNRPLTVCPLPTTATDLLTSCLRIQFNHRHLGSDPWASGWEWRVSDDRASKWHSSILDAVRQAPHNPTASGVFRVLCNGQVKLIPTPL